MIKIGNIDQTPYDYHLYIYSDKPIGPKVGIVMPNDFLYHNQSMDEHYMKFSFRYNKKIDFFRTDYINYKGIRFTLRKNYQPEEENVQSYRYELKFEAPEMLWLDIVSFYRYQQLKEADWSLTGKPEQFLQIGIDNINAYTNEEWKIGIIEPTDILNISFDSQNVFNMFTNIAKDFKGEWYPDYQNKTVNLVGHHEQGELITLQREISLTDIVRSNDNDKDYCTRLYAFGSTRNITTDYRGTIKDSLVDTIVQKRLRLPVKNGDYIDASPNMEGKQIIEKVKIFDHIYPKRIGTITDLRKETVKNEDGKKMTVFYFKDSELQFKSEYLLPGIILMLSFGDNSFLSGRDYELSYNDKTNEFEIINNQDIPEQTIPNDIMCPRIGDFYILYNFNISLVGNQYVPEAEQELLIESQKWMNSILEDNATYTCSVNPVYKEQHHLDMQVGQRIRLKSIIFNNGEKVSRVQGFDKYPITGRDTYTIGDIPKYSRLAKIDSMIEENKKITDMQYLEAMKVANGAIKQAKALSYLRTALQNETIIDGGLILTTLIQMGLMRGDVWINTAGISGIHENDDDIYLWGGGTLAQAVNLAENPYQTDDVASFLVTHSGLLVANQALIRGAIESNINGDRIVIDPSTRAIQLLSQGKGLVGRWGFFNAGSIIQLFHIPSTVQIDETQINGNTISFSSKNTESGFSLNSRIGVTGAKFDIKNFPTKSRLAELEIGELYRDGDVIKMKITD